jgi:hypothetical protein
MPSKSPDDADKNVTPSEQPPKPRPLTTTLDDAARALVLLRLLRDHSPDDALASSMQARASSSLPAFVARSPTATTFSWRSIPTIRCVDNSPSSAQLDALIAGLQEAD